MNAETIAMWYFIIGITTALINGYIRKIETDPLLTLTWVLAWWMTPIALTSVLFVYFYNLIKGYQPYRRAKIYFLRKF